MQGHVDSACDAFTPGGFPPDMAGKPVFRMAKRFPSFLGFVAELQCLGFRIAHDFVLVRLFAKSNPNERRLVSEHEVRKALHAGLRNSMVNYPTAYVQAISAYVGDWSGPCKWSPALLQSGMARRTIWRQLRCLRFWCEICQRSRNCAVSRARALWGVESGPNNANYLRIRLFYAGFPLPKPPIPPYSTAY